MDRSDILVTSVILGYTVHSPPQYRGQSGLYDTVKRLGGERGVERRGREERTGKKGKKNKSKTTAKQNKTKQSEHANEIGKKQKRTFFQEKWKKNDLIPTLRDRKSCLNKLAYF